MDDLRRDMGHVEFVSELSKAISLMEQVKDLNRKKEWARLLDKYPELRKILISLKSLLEDLTPNDKSNIQSTIQVLSSTEKKVEEHIEKGTDINVAQMNKVFSEHGDRLHQILTSIRERIGKGK